jgi:dGTPase
MLLTDGRGERAEGHFRLEHALEVTRVARAIARGLRLNEDLVEAIALGHDLGATPFGEAGERALSIVLSKEFRHNEHSVRVVERLEDDGLGLNLTWEVRDGILNHAEGMPRPATLEGQAVRVADELVTALHDLEAASAAGVLASPHPPETAVGRLTGDYGQQVTTMIGDVVQTSFERPEVTVSPALQEACSALRVYLDDLSQRPAARVEVDRAVHCLCSIAVFYLEYGDRLPPSPVAADGPEMRVVDFVAALTDTQVRAEFARLFMPGGRFAT